VAQLFRDFQPDLVQITGPSDVGTLGAMLAHRFRVPLAASWQTNLHQYARTRLSRVVSRLPARLRVPLLDRVERWSFRATSRFYKIPRLLFAPNPEMVCSLGAVTGKPCFLMSHSVNTDIFSPQWRNCSSRPFCIGYVGRFAPEKNVRWLARLEQALLDLGHRDFRMVLVGEGGEEAWLRKNLRQAEFTGVLTGEKLSRAFANMDVFVFPSETDTFGLAVLEALASGVPAVVTAHGGPKYSVQNGETGFVAADFDDLVRTTVILLTQPSLLSSMRTAAREYALSTSWDQIFNGMYRTYEHCLTAEESLSEGLLDVANT
jgi:phosphatidylinositol alpha 1,6-mannosyltransferase